MIVIINGASRSEREDVINEVRSFQEIANKIFLIKQELSDCLSKLERLNSVIEFTRKEKWNAMFSENKNERILWYSRRLCTLGKKKRELEKHAKKLRYELMILSDEKFE